MPRGSPMIGVGPFAENAGALPRFRPDGGDDAALVTRVQAAEPGAEAELYKRHARAICLTVRRLLGSSQEAEDVLQDTFVCAFEEIHRLRDAGAVRPWLLKIAVRQVHRRFRRQRILRGLGLGPARDAQHPSGGGLESLAMEGTPGETRAELALLDQVLVRLPPNERIAWLLRRVDGHALEDVAGLCGCSLATAKRRIGAVDDRVRFHTGAPKRPGDDEA